MKSIERMVFLSGIKSQMTFRSVCLSASLAVFASFQVLAEGEGYVTLESNTSYKKGFAGAPWSEDVPNPSTRDYLVANGYYLTTTNGETVSAKSLTFGVVGGTKGHFYDYYSVTFANEGVVFANGTCYPRASGPVISGKATFTSPATEPFIFYGDGYRPVGFTLAGDVHGTETSGVLAYSTKTNGFYLAFSGDVSKFFGSVVITSGYNTVGMPLGADLILKDSATYFGGSVTIGKDAAFNPRVAASVGSLTLADGASLKLVAGQKLTVRTAFGKGLDPVPVRLDGAPENILEEELRYDLITMPAGADCDTDDFFLVEDEDVFRPMSWLRMETSEDEETKTLYVVFAKYIKLIKHDEPSDPTDPMGDSAVTNATYWKDNDVVHGGDVVYYVSNLGKTTYLSLPYNDNEPYVFPAPGLFFGESTALFLRSSDNTVSNIFFRGWSGGVTVGALRGSSFDSTLRGNFQVRGLLQVNLRNGTTVRFVGPFTGNDGASFVVCSLAGSTSQCRGICELNGDNSKFAGKVQVTANSKTNVRFSDRYPSLIVKAANNLGGARDEFAFDALRVDTLGQLDVRGTFTLDEPTRGICLDDRGRISVTKDNCLTVRQQLTVNGPAYKEGAGTLALGGDLRFLDAEGAPTETVPEEAKARTFYVLGGVLKPLTAGALDGLDLVFSNMVSKLDMAFALDIGSEDAEMREKGICIANSSAPLSVSWQEADVGKKIPVRLEYDGEVPVSGYSFGIMTVKSGCEDAFDLIKAVLPSGYTSYHLTYSQIPDVEAGTVTLTGKMKKYGTVFSIR